MLRIDQDTAVFICAGPSIDRLSSTAWREIAGAGAAVSVNGAMASQALRRSGLRLTYVAALDVGRGEKRGLQDKVSGLAQIWATTPGWRITKEGEGKPEAESYIELELSGWTDHPNRGFAGGSTAMVTGNWICNDWTPADRERAEEIRQRTGKVMPRRSFRKLAYLGLDMVFNNPAHATGAGTHPSGFGDSLERYQFVRRSWGRFCVSAAERGIEVANLTPGTALTEMPQVAVPRSWISKPPRAAA